MRRFGLSVCAPTTRNDDTGRRGRSCVDHATSDRPLPDVVNLGTGHARTLAELLDAVGRAVDRPLDVRITPAADDDPDHTLADTACCAATLGWVPTTDLDDVVAAQLGRLRRAAA